MDHVVPFSKGGLTLVDNAQALCRKCNLEKGAHADGAEAERQRYPNLRLYFQALRLRQELDGLIKQATFGGRSPGDNLVLFRDEAAAWRWMSGRMGVADAEDADVKQLQAGVTAAHAWLDETAAKLRRALAELIHAQTGGATVVPERMNFWPTGTSGPDWDLLKDLNPNVYADAKIAWFVARTELGGLEEEATPRKLQRAIVNYERLLKKFYAKDRVLGLKVDHNKWPHLQALMASYRQSPGADVSP
jgi:hypothetical protein